MKHIARSTLIIAFFFGLTKIISIVRTALIARQFGLSSQLDAFNAANNLPDLLAALIAGGALAIAFIPVLSEYLERSGRPSLWALFSRVVNLSFMFTAGVSVLLALFAAPLVTTIIAPGFIPSQQALAVNLMRLDLIGTLLFAISGLVSAGLQANQHFLLPAMAPALYSLGQIFGVIVLAPSTPYQLGPITFPAFGMGIYGLVYGVILGALLHLGIQIPGLIHFQFRWAPGIGLHDPGVRKVLILLGPAVVSMFLFQLNFVARDNLASRLGPGSVTALTYGYFIMQVPETLLGTALAIALLPTLSEQIARGDHEVYRQTLNRALRILLALALPVTALLMVAIQPFIQLFFAFDAAGTQLMVSTTRAFLGGILGYAMVEIGVRAFYSQQKPITPLVTSFLRVVAYVGLSILLFRNLGTPGIALADTCAATFEGCLLFYLLNRSFSGVTDVRKTLVRIIPVALLCALGVAMIMRLVPVPSLLAALGALTLGGLAALPFMWPELKLLIKM
jgi:putative peptidoglycan lipid II flippase